MAFDKAGLLALDTRKVIEFKHPDLKPVGGKIWLRELSTAVRIEVSKMEEKKDFAGMTALVLSHLIVSEEGERLMSESEARGRPAAFGGMSSSVARRRAATAGIERPR